MAAPLCQECLQRPAFAWARKGKPKVIKDHDMCEKCWQSLRDRNRAAKEPAKPKRQAAPERDPSDPT